MVVRIANDGLPPVVEALAAVPMEYAIIIGLSRETFSTYPN